MASPRIASVISPHLQLGAVSVAHLALHRGEAMGFDTGQNTDPLEARLHALLDNLDQSSIARAYTNQLRHELDQPAETTANSTDQVVAAINAIYQALGENPVPRRETAALLKYFSEDQLAELLLISPSSVQRYARGERVPKAPVVERIHWLALTVGYLTGIYNEFGVRRWFERPRKALGGAAPKDALLMDDEWTPDTPSAQRVHQLAKASLGMAAT